MIDINSPTFRKELWTAVARTEAELPLKRQIRGLCWSLRDTFVREVVGLTGGWGNGKYDAFKKENNRLLAHNHHAPGYSCHGYWWPFDREGREARQEVCRRLMR